MAQYRSTRRLVAPILAAIVACVGMIISGTAVASAVPAVAGEVWTARTASEANSWNSVAYGNGVFVAVAYGGTNRVMTSPDGVTWTARAAAEDNNWASVVFGNGLFVAVSSLGTNRVMTSPDGVIWTARAAVASGWSSVTYGNGLFVAVSGSGTDRVMTSPDGVTWTARAAAEANAWNSVTFGNGLFVAVAFNGTNRVMTSPDGITWSASAGQSVGWNSVAFGNGRFVAVAPYGVGTASVMTSTDGTTWAMAAAAQANQWRAVTYGDGTFVAVASSGTNEVMTSTDGSNWTARSAAENNGWYGITYGAGKFVAVALSGTNRVMTSGPLATSPDAPTSLVATPGDGSASVAFTAGADGGASISNYEYQLDGGSWTALSPADTSSPVTIPGLTNGITYSVKLRAVNSVGSGAASASVLVTPAPTGPTTCDTHGISRYSIQVCWNPLVPTIGRVNRYRAYVYTAGTTTKVASCKGSAAETGCVVKGGGKLTPATDYDVTVRARVQLAPHQVVWTLFSPAVRVSTTP